MLRFGLILRQSSLHHHRRKMSTIAESDIFKIAKTQLVPDFSVSHKGMAGRVAVIGGSEEYTGAPFFSAMCAMRSGCDLAHVFCMPNAATAIKGYSPDLIVHPLLGPSEEKKISEIIGPWIPVFHSLVIGPGLGRDPEVLKGLAHIIALCREAKKPLVIDADGLWLAAQNPEVFINYPAPIVMTPNVPEYERLTKAIKIGGNVRNVAEAFGPHTVVLRKGPQDIIEGAKGESTVCTAEGSWRRCGGQGDFISGSIGTFLAWEVQQQITTPQTGIVSAYAACRLTRESNKRAFKKHGRSMCSSDMLAEVHGAFETLYGQ